MTSFFRRHHELVPGSPDSGPDEDSPARLLAALEAVVGLVNVNAGRLPVDSVVAALQVTDALRLVIDTADDQPLDVYAVVSVKGILTDYLPTTLRAYLALDRGSVDARRPSGRTPKESLLEQLQSIWLAATDVLEAVRSRDADALLTQGSFLRTKFAGSDLDL